jgi:hypothetical protein
MAREVSEFASQANGCVVAVASRRTGPRLESVIDAHLGPNGRLVRWADVQNDNPYLGYLATADVIVATADSESMIAEAAASGKPVFIYPVAERVAGPWRRLQRLVMRIAHSRPRKRRGTVRPQQGAEYFCARLIEKGWIRPPRDVEAMGKLLIEGGFAQLFGGPRVEAQTRPPIEIQGVARQVRELLTWTEDAAAVSKRDGDDGWLEFPPPTEVQDPLVDSATAS